MAIHGPPLAAWAGSTAERITTRTFRPLIACALALLALVGCSGNTGPSSAHDDRTDQERLTTAIALRFDRLIADRNLPYKVLQAEFQEVKGDSWWIVQFDDPIAAGVDAAIARNELPNTMDLMYFDPLQLYRDSLAPYRDRLGEVHVFILSFRDSDETTYEIEPREMWEYVEGDLTDEEMVSEIVITGLKRSEGSDDSFQVPPAESPAPLRNNSDFAGFAGDWYAHGAGLAIEPDGSFSLSFRIYDFCDDHPPPCDRIVGNEIIEGGLAKGRLVRGVDTVFALIIESTDPEQFSAGQSEVVLNTSTDTLELGGRQFCGEGAEPGTCGA